MQFTALPGFQPGVNLVSIGNRAGSSNDGSAAQGPVAHRPAAHRPGGFGSRRGAPAAQSYTVESDEFAAKVKTIAQSTVGELDNRIGALDKKLADHMTLVGKQIEDLQTTVTAYKKTLLAVFNVSRLWAYAVYYELVAEGQEAMLEAILTSGEERYELLPDGVDLVDPITDAHAYRSYMLVRLAAAVANTMTNGGSEELPPDASKACDRSTLYASAVYVHTSSKHKNNVQTDHLNFSNLGESNLHYADTLPILLTLVAEGQTHITKQVLDDYCKSVICPSAHKSGIISAAGNLQAYAEGKTDVLQSIIQDHLKIHLLVKDAGAEDVIPSMYHIEIP